MIRALYVSGTLALICTGAVLLHCVDEWLHGAPEYVLEPRLPVIERFRQERSGLLRSHQEPVSPLVEQAKAFASYLTPPEPVQPRQVQPVTSRATKTIEPVRPADTTAKFTLIATSYYGARPEKSLALVSQPGRENHWVRPGERLGHFILETVEQGSIVYRDGDQSRSMAIETRTPGRRRDDREVTLASGQTEAAAAGPPAPHEARKIRTRRPMQRLGPVRPESPLLARDQMNANG